MNGISRALLGGAGLLSVFMAGAPLLHAQAFPNKPLRMILPFPPGGPTDLLGRTIASRMSENVGQPVVVENRPGAGGNLGLEVASKAPPDGYAMTLSSPLIAISPFLYDKLNYDPAKDLVPISLVAYIQNILLVHPSVPAKNINDLIRIARAYPGKLNFSSGGIGTTGHLAAELLNSLMKIRVEHVPYKGSGQAMVGLMSGQTDMLIMAAPIATPHVQAGKIRALAMLSEKRHGPLPDVPTASESGVKNFEVPIWYGILTAAGTPQPLIGRLNQEIGRVMNDAAMREKFIASGIEPQSSTPEQFAAFIRSEGERYGKVIRAANIKPQ
jgi:tripartite-type tricarboxylate transporter receptor subunit TctC